jgi:hypothetical protein
MRVRQRAIVRSLAIHPGRQANWEANYGVKETGEGVCVAFNLRRVRVFITRRSSDWSLFSGEKENIPLSRTDAGKVDLALPARMYALGLEMARCIVQRGHSNWGIIRKG